MEAEASDIAWISVYPAFGIAGVGNAAGFNDNTLASDVIGGRPDARGGYQSPAGEIKRQAIRFRVYAWLKLGATVELVHGDGAEIERRVKVANRRAGWYQFNQAMDLPAEFVRPDVRRNADHVRRQGLDICPATRRIGGRNVLRPEYQLDDGQFPDRFVSLGELRTDKAERLLFLGGHGHLTPFYTGMRPITFANNNRWHDDVCDGPVRARVTFGGSVFEADQFHGARHLTARVLRSTSVAAEGVLRRELDLGGSGG